MRPFVAGGKEHVTRVANLNKLTVQEESGYIGNTICLLEIVRHNEALLQLLDLVFDLRGADRVQGRSKARR